MPRPNAHTHPNAEAFPSGVGGPVLRALANAGIRSLAGLTRWRERDFAALHGVGPKGVRILRDAMAAQGLAFRPEPPDATRPRKSR
jgi:predicted flap endonuclease-1-like 5' DNA nuclease